MSCPLSDWCAELNTKDDMENITFTFNSLHPVDKFVAQVVKLDGMYTSFYCLFLT